PRFPLIPPEPINDEPAARCKGRTILEAGRQVPPPCARNRSDRLARLTATGLTSIRVAKLGNAYTGQPPPHEIGHLCCARPTPPGGPPSISLRPPKALVVVDTRQSGPPSCTLQVCNCVGRSNGGPEAGEGMRRCDLSK